MVMSRADRLFVWQDPLREHGPKDRADPVSLWTAHIFVLSTATIVLFVLVTMVGMVYWCSRRRRLSKDPFELSELTPFSPALASSSSSKSREDTVALPKATETYASSERPPAQASRKKNLLQRLLSTFFEMSYMEVNTPIVRCNLWSTSRSLLFKRRRGSNNSLTISVTPIQLRLNSPPADCPPDEYLQTATRKLTIDELHQHAQDTRALYQEFWSTPTNHLEKLRIYGAGVKNRYGTILANEHSRVKLPELPGDAISAYINANYVSGWPNEPHAFIATQGPLSNTLVDFYRMIWQEHVPVVVMITRLIEKNKSKCERYIPEAQSGEYGPFHVHITSTVHRDDYEIRRLRIEFDNEQREIDHYWFTAWPDQSCPEVAASLIELVHKVENSRAEVSHVNQASGPVVVHCSAGIGRTGCFIALTNGIKQLNAERAVDVVRILCNLRRERGGMIQTHDQYQFLYQALSEYARTVS